ncbi:hypothetical protein BJY04DRAFT_215725 [Aspergillus karnatakaensis]|uniref:uncharacterized protein n=1 Tax=Aspergillus karnatakaensis TaxID=1810916 RepID=UPI003CCDE8C2
MSDTSMRDASQNGSAKGSKAGSAASMRDASQAGSAKSSNGSQKGLRKEYDFHSLYPFGCKLPTEVYFMIFEYAAGGSLLEGEFMEPPPPHWRLVNRTWNYIHRTITASGFSYDSNSGTLGSLYDFVRNIVKRPADAAKVKYLSFTTNEMHEPFKPKDYRRVFLTLWKGENKEFRRPRVKAQREAPEPRTDDEVFEWLKLGYLDENGRLKEGKHRKDALWLKLRAWYKAALYGNNREWVRKALFRVGFWDVQFPEGPNLFERAVRNLVYPEFSFGFERPLFALAIAYCPNLRNLRLHDRGAGDPFLDQILGYAVGRNTARFQFDKLPMQNLISLHVAPQIVRLPGARGVGYEIAVAPPGGQPTTAKGLEDYPCEIDEVSRPYYRLPALKELFANIVRTGDLASQIANPTQLPNRIEKLAFQSPLFGERVLGGYFPARAFEFNSLLSFAPRLRQLTLRLPKFIETDPNTTGGEVLNGMHDVKLYDQMWRAIDRFSQQLEYLDIYSEMRDPQNIGSIRNEPEAWNYCCPLAKFVRLRQLNLPIFLLAGYKCWCAAPFKLRKHLPLNLEVLGLYTHTIWGEHSYIESLEDELGNLVSNQVLIEGGRDLHTIVYDAECEIDGTDIYTKLRDNSEERGIRLIESEELFLIQGGLQTEIAWSVAGDVTADEWLEINKALEPESVLPVGLSVLGYHGTNVKPDYWTGPAQDAAEAAAASENAVSAAAASEAASHIEEEGERMNEAASPIVVEGEMSEEEL